MGVGRITASVQSMLASVMVGLNAGSQTFILKGQFATLNWAAGVLHGTWLSVSPNFGVNTGQDQILTASFATSGLAAGNYSDNIRIVDSQAANSPLLIPVTLIVTAVPVPPDVCSPRERRNPQFDRNRLQPIFDNAYP